MSAYSDSLSLSPTARKTAERIGRKMLKICEADVAAGREVSHEGILELSYELVDGNTDSTFGYCRWLDMRSVAEAVVLDAHPEWNQEKR